jgi:hypothetical protein
MLASYRRAPGTQKMRKHLLQVQRILPYGTGLVDAIFPIPFHNMTVFGMWKTNGSRRR